MFFPADSRKEDWKNEKNDIVQIVMSLVMACCLSVYYSVKVDRQNDCFFSIALISLPLGSS